MMEKKPDYVIELAVKRMLPKNKLADRMLTRLKIYAKAEHPHAGQIK
ncbi:MAG: uL13 family ribosomal protein [Elusimicrobiota bacterium]